MAQTKPVVLEPTMGRNPDSYRMLCNVVSRGGALERRPRIVATPFGNALMGEGTDEKTFSPQWTVVEVLNSTNVRLQAPSGILLVDAPFAGAYLYETYITTSHQIQKVESPSTLSEISHLNAEEDLSENGTVVATCAANHLLAEGDKVYVYQGTAVAASLVNALDCTGVAAGDRFIMNVPVIAGGDGVGHTFTIDSTTNINALSDATGFGISSTVASTTGLVVAAIVDAINGVANAAVVYGDNDIGTTTPLAAGTLGLTAAISESVKITLTMDDTGADGNVHDVLQSPGPGFEGDLLLESSFTGGASGEHAHTRNLAAPQVCLEGIDCEIIHGNIVAIYVAHAGYALTDTYFYHSYHYSGDPRMGTVRDVSVYGSKKDDNPSSWYKQAAYWNRRIVPTFTDYMITGHNVGPDLVGGNKAAFINEAESVSLFTGLPVKMLAGNATRNVSSRADPFSSFYSLYSPKNAFAHVDRHGSQVLWYGFLDGEHWELNATLPSEDVVLSFYYDDLTEERDTLIVRPYHVWYSDPGRPLSLSLGGWVPLATGSRNMNIVGIADFKDGQAIFSHDTIHFMRGVAADVESGQFSRLIVSDRQGADSRWSIKTVGDGVAFANKDGLWFLDGNAQVKEISGFSELFSEDGVDCSRGPYHEYFGTVGNTPTENADDVSKYAYGGEDILGAADVAYSVFDSHPWRTFKVDKSRLDRAVAGVWGDLYLLFVSLDSDPYGEDNRLCLCWNWRESGAQSPRHAWRSGPTSVWLLPKNMGVRGWAYDGSLSCPYVMTRYGLAKFEKSPAQDIAWQNTGPTAVDGTTPRVPEHHPVHVANSTDGLGHVSSVNTSERHTPIIMGQSHWMPETGDSFVTTNVIVQHETKNDTFVAGAPGELWTDVDAVNRYYNGPIPFAGCAGGDADGKMRIRLWAMQGEMQQSSGNFSSFPFGKMRFTKADIAPLENLGVRSGFKLWRGRHTRFSTNTWGPLDTEGTVRLPKAIRRASSARGGFSSSRCAFQFSTSNPDKILSVQVIMTPVASRGEGA